MDMNKDGMIDRKDFEAIMKRVLVGKDNVTDLWGVFSKDGRAISYEEFKKSIIEPVQAKLTLDFEAHAMKKLGELFRKKSDNLDLIFKTFDTDGDGELSPEELRRGLSHIGFSISGPELEQLVKSHLTQTKMDKSNYRSSSSGWLQNPRRLKRRKRLK